jgi:hypothetical protein
VPRDGTLLGALFESLMTLTMRVAAQAAEARVAHLRTIDAVVVTTGQHAYRPSRPPARRRSQQAGAARRRTVCVDHRAVRYGTSSSSSPS